MPRARKTPYARFATSAPEGSFIKRYYQYMGDLETPLDYDFWCAVWLIGLAIGRECTVARPRIPVHMNWYVILTAESGVTRKSTAVKFAERVAARFIELCADHTMMITNKTTPEALENEMHISSEKYGHAHLAIIVSELVRFVGREKYNVTMPGLLTDLYDAPAYRPGGGTLHRRVDQRNVYVSFLSASTPSWLLRAINPDVVEGGFTSRTAFVFTEQPKHSVPWPDEGGRDDMVEELAQHLIDIRHRSREVRTIKVSDDGIRRFSQWYNRRVHSSDPFRASYESREDSHVLRLAGCLAANDEGWLIRPSHIQTATAIIEHVKQTSSTIFEGGFTRDDLVQGIDEMRTQLIAAGLDGIQQSTFYNKVRKYLSNEAFKLALEMMHELKMVRQLKQKQAGAGRPRVIWQGTTLIIEKGAIEQVLKMMKRN